MSLINVIGQKDEEARILYPLNSEIRVKEGGDWGQVAGHVNSGEFRNRPRETAVIRVEHFFGTIKDYGVDEIEPWSDSRKPAGLFGKLLCSLGLHLFESEPSRRDLVKNTGTDLAFWTSAVQKAVKVCQRTGCNAQKMVWRSGWCGLGGTGTPWKKLSPKMEAWIDSLSNL